MNINRYISFLHFNNNNSFLIGDIKIIFLKENSNNNFAFHVEYVSKVEKGKLICLLRKNKEICGIIILRDKLKRRSCNFVHEKKNLKNDIPNNKKIIKTFVVLFAIAQVQSFCDGNRVTISCRGNALFCIVTTCARGGNAAIYIHQK